MTIYRNKAFRNICAVTGVAILVAACATTHEDKESTLPCTIMQQSSRCAEVPMSDLQNEMVVKKFKPAPSGSYYVYVSRPYSQERSHQAKVYLDDKLVTALAPQTFARLQVAPGLHTLKVTVHSREDVQETIDAKGATFLEYQIVEHFFSAVSTLKVQDEGVAKKMLERLRLVALPNGED
ncbi:hypothetical protein [Herbaspirillum sp. CAH-3]|uniref:hypothetical protein n=1 Tax=Herbaspirillum sp. CAH-3 TaxID=2605746 RepID=UPI0012AC5EEE|nr:hypothetical protein [Herbaspirillum sp. CAH-3]MRT31074.1 hypothetical protein [Herbaspirillum sp. CAH-3]